MAVFGPGHRPRPTPLPRSIPPFPAETTRSYLARLATANQLTTTRLRILITGDAGHHRIEAHQLAAVSARSVRSLRHALPDLEPGFVTSAGPAMLRSRRHPCRHCTARRRIHASVTCWLPVEKTLCQAHRLWLGASIRTRSDTVQHDLSGLPELLHAQRRHQRLARRHGPHAAARAFLEAAQVTACWAHRGFPSVGYHQRARILLGTYPEGGPRRNDPLIPVATYPETVALASVLAQPRWRHPPVRYENLAEASRALTRFGRELNHQVGHDRWLYQGTPDPLDEWFFTRWRAAQETASDPHPRSLTTCP